MNTLDWKKLEAFIAERKPVEVSAGILNDWFWTGATVYEKGEWQDKSRAWVTSDWATPGFKATMENGDVIEVVASVEETEEQAVVRKADREENHRKLKELVASIDAKNAAAPHD